MKFDYLRGSLDIGSQSAESDELRKKYFVAIEASRQVNKANSLIILGRKGSGKSALRMKFAETLSRDTRHRSVLLSPSLTDLEAVFRYLTSAGPKELAEPMAVRLWELTILMSVARAIHPKSAGDSITTEALPNGLFANIDAPFTLEMTVGIIECTPSQSARLRSSLIQYLVERLSSTNLRCYVLIDRLDDIIPISGGLTKQIQVLSDALWSVCEQFLNKERNPLYGRVFLRVFFPTDLYKASRTIDHLREHIRRISWTDDQLTEFLTWRLLENLPSGMQAELGRLDTEQRRRRVWSYFLPHRMSFVPYGAEPYKHYPMDMHKVMTTMALSRPRDLQDMMQLIGEETVLRGLNFPDYVTMLNAFAEYSERLLLSVIAEHRYAYPAMEKLLRRFANNEPILARNTLWGLIGAEVDDRETDIYAAASRLFEAGVIGATREMNKAVPTFFYYDKENFSQLSESPYFVIHRGLWRALHLRYSESTYA